MRKGIIVVVLVFCSLMFAGCIYERIIPDFNKILPYEATIRDKYFTNEEIELEFLASPIGRAEYWLLFTGLPEGYSVVSGGVRDDERSKDGVEWFYIGDWLDYALVLRMSFPEAGEYKISFDCYLEDKTVRKVGWPYEFTIVVVDEK